MTRTCVRCGAERHPSDMANVTDSRGDRWLCHPAWSVVSTCYMRDQWEAPR